MSLILPPFREERLRYAESAGKIRQKADYVKKLPYFFTIPTFSFSNTWKGASEILGKFYYEFEKNFSILDYLAIVPDGNYIPCVSWKVLDVVKRYRLWYDNDGLLYVPAYNGVTISKNFYLEIWSTNNPIISGGGTNLKISKFKLLLILCETGEVDLAPTLSTCNDMIFNMVNFDPLFGDHFVVVNTCLDTEMIAGIDTPEIAMDLGSIASNIQVNVINQDTAPDSYQIWKKTSTVDWTLFDTVVGTTIEIHDLGTIAGDFWQYKIRAVINGEFSEYSNIVGVCENYSFPGFAINEPGLSLVLGDFNVDEVFGLTSVLVPNLQKVTGSFFLDGRDDLNSVNLTSLQNVGGQFHMDGCDNIQIINLTSFVSALNGFFCDGCLGLTQLNLPLFVLISGKFHTFDNCDLTAASVNNILARGVVSGIAGATISLDGGGNAAPTGQGIADKATLIGQGNAVTTN